MIPNEHEGLRKLADALQGDFRLFCSRADRSYPGLVNWWKSRYHFDDGQPVDVPPTYVHGILNKTPASEPVVYKRKATLSLNRAVEFTWSKPRKLLVVDALSVTVAPKTKSDAQIQTRSR